MMNTVRFAIDNRKERRTDITEEKGDNKINQYLIYSCMYALKYSEARRQYPKRLKLLFCYLGLKWTSKGSLLFSHFLAASSYVLFYFSSQSCFLFYWCAMHRVSNVKVKSAALLQDIVVRLFTEDRDVT